MLLASPAYYSPRRPQCSPHPLFRSPHPLSLPHLSLQISEAVVKQYEAELAATRKQIDTVNRERKLQQMAAGQSVRRAGRQAGFFSDRQAAT